MGWTLPNQTNVTVIAGQHLSPLQPTVRIYSDLPNVAEGSAAVARFKVVRRGAPTNNPLVVDYTTAGDAINGVDYALLPGSITIPAGERSATLEISPQTDSLVEGNESVVVQLRAGSGYQVGLQSERTVHGTIQDDAAVPAGGVSLWNGSQLSDFSYFGASFSTQTDPLFGNVIQAVISTQPANLFSVQLRQTIDSPVNAGDILLAEFRVKSVGGPGEISAIFERAGAPYTKSLAQGLPASTDWEKVQIPFVAAESYLAGEASFGFHLGHQIQTLQFTDFQLLNYGPPKSLAPETNLGLNNISGSWGTSQTVSMVGQPFSVAYQVETITQPAMNWHLQALERNTGIVSNGDTMRVEFFMRGVAGANPRSAFVMQRTDTYASLFSNPAVSLTSAWQYFSFDIVATAALMSQTFCKR